MTDDLQQAIAAEVRAEVARQKRSQAQIAECLGIHQTAVSKKLRGDRDFTLPELVLVAELLRVPVTNFLPAQGAAA